MQEVDLEEHDSESEVTDVSTEKLKAAALKPGDRVALVAPSSRPESPLVLKRSVQIIEELGYRPVLGKHVLKYSGFSAGFDQERFEDLNTFINDDSISAIMCLSGGYGALRVLPLLDFSEVRIHPKIIVGSGDSDVILSAVNHLTGLVVFHGPNLDEVSNRYTFDSLRSVLSGYSELPVVNCRDADDEPFEGVAYSLSDKTCNGMVRGGNLTAISSLFGTRYKPDFEWNILALSDFGERNSILDRWFTTLYLSGTLHKLAGIAFGAFPNCHPRGSTNMLSIEDTFGDRIKELNLPACFGFKFGNSGKSQYLPIGINAQLDCAKGILSYIELPHQVC